MKRVVVKFSILWILLFSFTFQSAWGAGSVEKIKVTLISAELVENNHVGNEWWWSGFVNGKELADGESVNLSVSKTGTVTLHAEAVEQDKIPDSGEASAVLKVSALKATQSKALTVNVVENRGRYSGNTATWKFTFKLEKVK